MLVAFVLVKQSYFMDRFCIKIIMSFIDVIKETLIKEEFPAPFFRAVMLGDNAFYLEGVVSILDFTSQEITVRLKKGGVTLLGEDFKIVKYSQGDLAVCGKIKSVQRI